MQQKKDRRVQYTKMILRETLLDMLKTKKLNDISISELCKIADVSRNTFYSHYASPYKILEELETEMHNQLMSAIHHTTTVKEIILVACRSLEQNQKMSKLIFSQTDASGVLSKVLSSVKNDPDLGEKKNGAKAPPIAAYVYVFSEKGAVAIIQEWVRNSFKEPAEVVANLISVLVSNLEEAVKKYYKQ